MRFSPPSGSIVYTLYSILYRKLIQKMSEKSQKKQIITSAAKLCMLSFDKIFSKIRIAVAKSCLKSLHQGFGRCLIKNIHKLELQLLN